MPTNLQTGFYVMAGGACGAAMRYFFIVFAGQLEGKALWGVLAANLVGCFLAGVLFALQPKGIVSTQTYYFLAVGLLGSLTTLSTFSVENLGLFGLPDKFVWTNIWAWLYFSLTTFGGLAACVLGMRLTY